MTYVSLDNNLAGIAAVAGALTKSGKSGINCVWLEALPLGKSPEAEELQAVKPPVDKKISFMVA
ncbi:MAG: hypothetical protein LBC46_05320 [Treponema sp.]|jgi:hypothetical protein|nr:hypothetical protein [Treponema sp.]